MRELTDFLGEYAAWILGCGCTCIRLERNAKRIGAAFGASVELNIMPRHIFVTCRYDDSEFSYTAHVAVKAVAINFTINAALSSLSWAVADHKVSYAEMLEKFRQIVTPQKQNNTVLLLLVAAANASFCRLFGGDAIAMLIVAVATWAGFFLKIRLLEHHVDVRVTFCICAVVSSVLGASDYLFGLGTTPALTVGTSILYLVPGIPFINSFSDMLNRHYICALSRFIDACVLTACLSLGLCVGMLLMNIGMF